MTRRISLPKIDSRTANDLLSRLCELAPRYTREWSARNDKDPGVGLLKIFSFIAEGVINRLNRAPARNFLAFLEMLGIRLLPATSARVPVRFLPAQGTEIGIQVNQGTQVSAPPGEGQNEPIAFETMEDLVVIPATLSSMIAVDPEQDAIYKPPPGFLGLSMEASELPLLKSIAFSAAGSRDLQLDPPKQVEKGDFLHIESQPSQTEVYAGCVQPISPNQLSDPDYVTVADTKGQLIMLEEPLGRDCPDQTSVRKLTKFDLFTGRNFQAHMLYIGHGKYFEIKEEARIELIVTQALGVATNLEPLKIAWEYYGEVAKVNDWYPLIVEADETNGLSRNGKVTLLKLPGEIKEYEVDGKKSRWIRARLVYPMPAIPVRQLPDIESIELKVSTILEVNDNKYAGIPVDKVFYNETPLPLTRFNPFGFEPRTFDRFYVASNETFSKPGATVAMNVNMDVTDLLASPTVLLENNMIKAFAHGAAGRLMEFLIDPAKIDGSFRVINHKTPLDRRIVAGSIPSALKSRVPEYNRVFVKVCKVGKESEQGIYLCTIYNGTVQNWFDLQAPPGKLMFDPIAVGGIGPHWSVYVVSDNNIYTRQWLSPWELVEKAPSTASIPCVFEVISNQNTNIWMIIIDTMGHTYLYNGQESKNITPTYQANTTEVDPDYLAKQPSSDNSFIPHPSVTITTDAANAGNTLLYVFLINSNDELVVFDAEGSFRKILGKPENISLESNPSAVVAGDDKIRIFVRGSDDRLWEKSLDGEWTADLNPEEYNLVGDPLAIGWNQVSAANSISVLSASDKNSLLEYRIISNTQSEVFAERGESIPEIKGELLKEIVRPFSKIEGQLFAERADYTPGTWQVYRDSTLTELRPELSWEYWNGAGWAALSFTSDTTENFLVSGVVTIDIPNDIAKTEVGGQENYWIRARIVGGDYGRELYTIINDKQLLVNKDSIRPPRIYNLTLNYELKDEQWPQFCITSNNLSYVDQTAANLTPDKHFPPYVTLPVDRRSLYFGFDKEFEGGPVRIYFAAKELEVEDRSKPELDWTFTKGNDWIPISADDGTDALTKPGIVTWIVPPGFQRRQFFGDGLYWVRATLKEGDSWNESPLLSGVFPNSVDSIQVRSVRDEIIGSSTGTPHQKFRFSQFPIQSGEDVRVRESLYQQERDQLIAAWGPESVFDIRDLQGRIQETWVRWKEVIEFFDSGPDSRHYRLDRASGEIEFGDNAHGRIPPAGGDNIRAFSYQAGGGSQGNVAAGAINSMVTAIAGIESAINPVAAGGGSETATVEQMFEIGPAQISNRDRAVTPEDFEELAKEASREVAKARCLPNRNNLGLSETGWVTLYIVPNSADPQPKPSLGLRRTVQRYLTERADVTLVAQEHIFVSNPTYVPVNVDVTVNAKSFDVAGDAELKVREKIGKYLHPLTGGPTGEGWDFGRGLAASDLYALIEDLEEVDHVQALSLSDGEMSGLDFVEVEPDELLASGTHTITIQVGNGA